MEKRLSDFGIEATFSDEAKQSAREERMEEHANG
jgi:hypothetical protein